MKGIEHAGCVRGAGQAMAFLLSLEGIQRRDSHSRAEVFAALGQPVLMHGARPSWDQVRSSGPWDDPPRERSTMPVSSRGPRRRRSWWCHTPLVNPQHPNPRETGRIIRCGLQTRLDMGPHGIPRSCQLSSQSCNGGSLEAQLSDRPADRPHTQTRPGRAHRVVLLDEGRDLAGVFAAYPAPLKPSDPRRDPGPGRVDRHHRHATVALCDHPTTWAPNQLVARLNIEHQSIWGASHARQMETLQIDEQITPITTTKRHAAAGRARHRPKSFEDRGGRSPLIIKDLDLYPQPPDQHPLTHTQLRRAPIPTRLAFRSPTTQPTCQNQCATTHSQLYVPIMPTHHHVPSCCSSAQWPAARSSSSSSTSKG